MRPTRTRQVLSVFAFLATLPLIVAPMIDPTASVAIAEASDEAVVGHALTQSVVADGVEAVDLRRDAFTTSKIIPKVTVAYGVAPAAGAPDPGTAQAIAKTMVAARGWSNAEYSCLVALWNKESHWNIYAHNVGSGAYGIPQALPGSKMASAGADWATNPKTQITWGLGYVQGRYGTPCGAWGHSQQKGWY
ncbi:MAG: transglycosylase SLT domain-containing protein [Microbacteriaceae bacterium]